jgi:ABC-type dipeptide/oligopeptide/nickel transport system permease subunit
MLNDARNHLFDAPHMVVFPALAVLLSVLAFNLLVMHGATGSIPAPAPK